MKQIIIALVVASLASLAVSETATAQSRGGGPSMRRNSKPVTSPYLNLLNRGNNGGGVGFNYFQRVKPEQEFRSADTQLRQGLNSVQRQVNNQQAQAVPPQSSASNLTQSGHPTSFFSTGNYYPGSRQGR